MASATQTHPDPPPGATPAFIPLEANPELMTSLLHKLGLSTALQCHDVFSISDKEMLQFIPRPALALLLVFPVSAVYESQRMAEDAPTPEYTGKGDQEPVLWFKQTIRNACGMMGLLHAVSNGPARNFVEPDTELDKLIKAAEPLPPAERSKLIEQTQALASAHHEAASQGATAAPDAQDDVDLHYVCFVKTDDGMLWELDGRRKGPIARGKLVKKEDEDHDDVLCHDALLWGPLKFLEREGADMRFSCVALASSLDN
ncbi:ubiquitin carboxyl-terminal hydrolase [Apiospora kogelbergensis]|uniref:Ubiquitin carboxyl-terminal hydrolase n=1 Tax=Apiospora kogelbergensis TaxID=1337665 RepID=A0AAW0QSV4_9PEZI